MDDPNSKILWAQEHLNLLEKEVDLFCSTPNEAYTVTYETDIEHQRYLIRMKLHDIPPKICLIAADAVYSMRSCLDQIVWALASLTNRPPGHVQFPIVEVLNRDTFKRFAEQLFGIPDEAFCEIKAMQPYHRGDAFKGHPLWRLNEMCNLDKHRRIPAHGTVLDGVLYGVNSVSDLIEEAHYDCHILSVPLARKDQMHFEPRGSVQVTFGGDRSGIEETVGSLRQIHKFVTLEVLSKFNRFFA